jgi:hypothetical protein
MAKAKNADKNSDKFKSLVVSLKEQNKKLTQQLKLNQALWKKKLDEEKQKLTTKLKEVVRSAEAAIVEAEKRGTQHAVNLLSQIQKEKAKVLAAAEAAFDKKYAKKTAVGAKKTKKTKSTVKTAAKKNKMSAKNSMGSGSAKGRVSAGKKRGRKPKNASAAVQKTDTYTAPVASAQEPM